MFKIGIDIVRHKQNLYVYSMDRNHTERIITFHRQALSPTTIKITVFFLSVRLLSVNLFFASAGTVPNTLFFKDKDFKFIAWRTFIIQILVGALAIVAALMGAGLYTLLIQPILSSALIYFISLRKYPQKLLWTWGIDSLKKIWAYSMYQFLFSVMSYFIRNLDKMLIGKYIGMAPLGYYEKSYRLMSLPIQNITYVITPVLHPILSDYQKEEKDWLLLTNEWCDFWLLSVSP